jgi:hypothetical protein
MDSQCFEARVVAEHNKPKMAQRVNICSIWANTHVFFLVPQQGGCDVVTCAAAGCLQTAVKAIWQLKDPLGAACTILSDTARMHNLHQMRRCTAACTVLMHGDVGTTQRPCYCIDRKVLPDPAKHILVHGRHALLHIMHMRSWLLTLQILHKSSRSSNIYQ